MTCRVCARLFRRQVRSIGRRGPGARGRRHCARKERRRKDPRIAFQILPSLAVRPAAAPGWQGAAAGALGLFTAATCLQLALVANLSRLPKVRSQ